MSSITTTYPMRCSAESALCCSRRIERRHRHCHIQADTSSDNLHLAARHAHAVGLAQQAFQVGRDLFGKKLTQCQLWAAR